LIERSGSCRLSLKLGTHLNKSQLAELRRMVIDHFHRVEYLDLSYWPAFEFPTGVKLSLPCLCGLKLQYPFEAPVICLMAPVLQQIVLEDLGCLDSLFFPWSQLTTIGVEWISLDEYSYLMNELVNIVHCRLCIHLTGNLR
jgi:hypothetical protein